VLRSRRRPPYVAGTDILINGIAHLRLIYRSSQADLAAMRNRRRYCGFLHGAIM